MKRMVFLALMIASAASAASVKPSIVLVHGAFADASSWSKVIPILQKDGYYVTAVQIPLTSLPDDVATTKRVIDAQKGPMVVVGHSYAGMVITDAAAGNSNVTRLPPTREKWPETSESIFHRHHSPRHWFRMPPAFSMSIARKCTTFSPKTCRKPTLASSRSRKSR